MNTNQTNREAWRKFLGIKDPSATLENGRTGGVKDRTAGRAGGAGGGGALDSDSVPEGSDDEESAEKGDGGADAGNRLKPGDDADRLEDLYDCETGEKVTIDGFGEKGSEKYPTGFQDCKDSEVDPDYNPDYYWYQKSERAIVGGSTTEVISESYHQTKKQALAATWQNSEIQTHFGEGVSGSFAAPEIQGCHSIGCVMLGTQLIRGNCSSATNPSAIATCQLPPLKNKWPAVDKNHLNWNKEKGCFEPLCPDLNTAVSDKYKDCGKEHVLCDKDGNKVKVEVEGSIVKVTQAKYNQTAEIKNGKVQTVKKLTESQTEAEFK